MERMLTALLCMAVLVPSVATAQSFGEGALIDAAPAVVTPPVTTRTQGGYATVLLDDLIDGMLQVVSQPAAVSATTFTSYGCTNLPTAHHGHGHDDEHLLARVNQFAGLPAGYEPTDLVNIAPHINTRGGQNICLTRQAAAAWTALDATASARGLQLVVTSGYRSAADQAALYTQYAPLYNTGVYKRVAHAGHSEHQLGTTVDVAGTSAGYLAGQAFAQSPEWRWMQQHAHKYGFVMSYHQGAEHLTGYQYEPWHWRYVGRDVATVLRAFDHSLAFHADYRSPVSLLQTLSTSALLTAGTATGPGIGG